MSGEGAGTASRPPLRLSAEAAETVRREIARAGGREVSFLAAVEEDGTVASPRAVARGNREAVLAVARDAPDGALMLHNHPSGVLEPSQADLSVAARLWDEGLGTAITDNEATGLYVVVEPPTPRVREELAPDELDRLLGPGGALSTLHPGYEDRPGQRDMLRLVTDTYNREGIAVVEAGTGTGKSLAYLLPAVAWAGANGERTVVSTATINLQEQLSSKDLPLVEQVLGREVEWALVKGRGNYLSIRRARLAAETASSLFDEDRSREMEAILEWMAETEDGSLSDLSFLPSSDAWEEVRSDPDICLRTRCPHFQECFYQRSRRRAASAELLVVNHHLLFTDLAVRRASGNWTASAVLPPFRHLVLDEAHNAEDAATSHLGVEVTRTGIKRLLDRLDRKGKGLLTAVQDALAAEKDDEAPRLRGRIEERIRPVVSRARSRTTMLVEALAPVLPAATGEPLRLGAPRHPEPIEQDGVRDALDGLLDVFAELAREVAKVRDRLESDDGWRERFEGRILDLRSVERRIQAYRSALRLVLDPGDDAAEHVRWLERKGKGGRNVVLAAAPVEVGPLLREHLFDRLDTSILTSATLAVNDSFAFVRGRLGLGEPWEGEGGSGGPEVGAEWPDGPEEGAEWPGGPEEGAEPGVGVATAFHDGDAVRPPGSTTRARPDDPRGMEPTEAIVPSPFDFREQALFCVPTDLPGPGDGGDAFERATSRAVLDLAAISGGGLFVLFTSHRALRRVASLLREGGGRGLPGPLFVHGEDDRARLLRDFVSAGDGILLGTASFWEGVDVPGRPLRGLILQKIPFRVPTDPVVEAREEALEARGINPFYGHAVPHAALRLKQGFGRLIRSRMDRGAAVLLDDRILRRRYGRILLDSLPEVPVVRGPWERVEAELRSFYGGKAGGRPGEGG